MIPDITNSPVAEMAPAVASSDLLPSPYYDADGITLYCGDALSIAPLLNHCDAIVTDPPYNETSLEWDVWPAGWPSVMAPITRQMWCFGSLRMFWDYRDEFCRWNLAQEVVWEKHNGSGIHSDRFRRVHELAIHFYQGEWGTLYKQPPIVAVDEDRKRNKLIRGRKPAHWGGVEMGKGYDYNGKRLQRSVISVTSCHGYAVNETQKPEGIIEPLLNYCVPAGGIVLDPFAGSGTVLSVARTQGKLAIGIEKRESQCEEITKRLSQRVLGLETNNQ